MKYSRTTTSNLIRPCLLLVAACLAPLVSAQVTVTYAPYIQLGDSGPLGQTDQMVIAWQTNETSPNASAYAVNFGMSPAVGNTATITGRVVDNYLSADPVLAALSIPTVYGAHVDYYAVLSGLNFATSYSYKVTGPGMPANGFTASFNTRKTGSNFSFIVEGDEGYFPFAPSTNTLVNYEARIAHLINNVSTLSVAGLPSVPPGDIILNTGDNIYNQGTEDNYRDFFFPVLNSNTDSNETGAPILRSTLYFVVGGNHDFGATGVNANLLADNSAARFTGSNGGGDSLSFFNNFYYPMNGPVSYDIQNTWNYNTDTLNGMLFSYNGNTYTSPSAISAFRASTTVNTGQGTKQQIDHMSNFSFDYGNTHFLYLDANPHLFNGNLPSGSVSTTSPVFTAYPSGLLQWLVNDLDSTKQTWKVVVYHQPGFSSGDATELNHQMRAVAKVLEDHGVNMVFNGHEHNYQRTLPIRSTANTPNAPFVTSGGPAVAVDTTFNGTTQTVPNGVLYLVEGAGGNRDFDGNLAPPRGSGTGVDQDDSATGTFTVAPGFTVNQGPSDWLDINLTNLEMANLVPNAGTAQKITTKFKSKVFSFGDLLVTGNSITLYQISEPLQSNVKSGLYGNDVNGNPINDPIPDTVLNATTGALMSSPATGTSSLLDAWTITKPNLAGITSVQLSAPPNVTPGGLLVYSVVITNGATPINGAQVRLTPASGVAFAGTVSPALTVQGSDIVATIGHMDAGTTQEIQFATTAPVSATVGTTVSASAIMTSGTALALSGNSVTTSVISSRRAF